MDYSLSTSYANEDRDPSRDIVFQAKDIDLTYDISNRDYPTFQAINGADLNDLSEFEFDEFEQKDGENTYDRNTTASGSPERGSLLRGNL